MGEKLLFTMREALDSIAGVHLYTQVSERAQVSLLYTMKRKYFL
jgi:hypothetical protein